MGYTVQQLREMPEKALVDLHDGMVVNYVVTPSFLLDELERRERVEQARRMEEQAMRMEGMTRAMLRLTYVVGVLTLVNVIAVFIDIIR